jgi:YggT family protein
MNQALAAYGTFVFAVRQALFWLAVVVAVIALLDWLVRTRRLQPFGPVARFCRRYIDPLLVPIERRVVRAGGQPSSAPWWTLVGVVVGGLLVVALLDFLQGAFASLAVGTQSPLAFLRLTVAWAFAILRIALIVRVFSSWFQISPYSKWIRWSFQLTEWMLGPLRRIVPMFGPIDITPIVAFLLLAILQRIVGGVL